MNNNKPLILEIEDFKQTLINNVNKAIREQGLPCYLVNMVIENVQAQLREGVRTEIEMAQQQVNKEEKENVET